MDNKTFCAAPWFGIRFDSDGQYRPCCQLSEDLSDFTGQKKFYLKDASVDQWMTSEYSRYLRQQLTEGNRIPECSRCWKKEDHGLDSLRIETNNIVTGNNGRELENTWVKMYVNRHSDYKSYYIRVADVKVSNVCNFACAMCEPSESSKLYDRWNKDSDNEFVQEKLTSNINYFKDITQTYQDTRNYNHLVDILKQPVAHLKLLGGEPLLDKKLFELLDNHTKKEKLSLHFITNGSQDMVAAADKLKDYHSVSFGVSLEGIGDMQDYVRNGSNWPKVEHNILAAVNAGIRVSITHVLQAMSVIQLHKLVEWCKTHNLDLQVQPLIQPEYLSVGVLPMELRKLACENLAPNLQDLILSTADASDQYPRFLKYVEWYEQTHSLSLAEVCPKFKTA